MRCSAVLRKLEEKSYQLQEDVSAVRIYFALRLWRRSVVAMAVEQDAVVVPDQELSQRTIRQVPSLKVPRHLDQYLRNQSATPVVTVRPVLGSRDSSISGTHWGWLLVSSARMAEVEGHNP